MRATLARGCAHWPSRGQGRSLFAEFAPRPPRRCPRQPAGGWTAVARKGGHGTGSAPGKQVTSDGIRIASFFPVVFSASSSQRTPEAAICLICKKQKRSPPKHLGPAGNTPREGGRISSLGEEGRRIAFFTLLRATIPECPLRNSWRCWRRSRRAAKREGGWPPPPRRTGSGRGDFYLAAKVRGLTLEPPLHTHRDAPSVPRRYSSCPLACTHTRRTPTNPATRSH